MHDPSHHRTLSALIKMLDDPDDRVYHAISKQLLAIGKEAIPALETALGDCFDEQMIDRIGDLLSQLQQADLLARFKEWSDSETRDLLKGFILVSSTDYRNIDEVEISAMIAQIKTDVWIELHDDLTALENVRVINHILFRVRNFEGNRENITAPDNSYINRLLETHKGNPLSLGMLYLIIARQLGLPITGVDLPQHFILAYLNSDEVQHPTESDILFYINPFNHGAIFSKREIDQFLSQMKIKPEPTYYRPCTNKDIICKLLKNLIFAYTKLGMEDKLAELENLLKACS